MTREWLSLRLRRMSHRLGPIGLLGVGLIVFAAAETLGTAVPAYREAADLAERIADMRAAPRLARQIEEGPGSDPVAQLVAFERYFPERGELTRAVDRIHRMAAAQELTLVRGDYRLEADRELGILRYQITLPVNGRYSKIKGFARQLLQDIPYSSLDGISIQRPGVGEQELECLIRISLFVREEG